MFAAAAVAGANAARRRQASNHRMAQSRQGLHAISKIVWIGYLTQVPPGIKNAFCLASGD